MHKLATTVAIVIAATTLANAHNALAAGRTQTIIPLFSQEIVITQPENWAVAYQYHDPKTSSVQFLPAGQTLTDWQEMIAVQAYKGLARHTEYGPEIMLKAIRSELAAHCAGEIVAIPLEPITISGHKASGMLMGCPQASDDFGDFRPGKGEMALYVSIKGRQDFYVIRHAVRGERFQPETPPLNLGNFLDYADKTAPLMLCENGDTIRGCLARDSQPPG